MKLLLALALIAGGVGVLFAPDSPKLLNYVIMGLYLAAAAWWLWHARPVDTCYWLAAFAITATVTFGYRH